VRLQGGYAGAALAEIRLAAAALGRRPAGRDDGVLRRRHADAVAASRTSCASSRASRLSSDWRLKAEVTVEANPDSVDPSSLAALRAGGVNRVSFGMQSVRRHVLAVLDRTHTPGRPEAAVAERGQRPRTST
jgi:oxygen-independent coproporphyrinogen-3 oxidase